MAGLSANNINQIGDIVRSIFQDSIKGVESRLDGLDDDMKMVRTILGSHGILLRTLQTQVSGLNSSYRTQSIMLEDLNDQFSVLAEALEDKLI